MESSSNGGPGFVAPALADIKKQCAQRLMDRLRDPQVRAEKGSNSLVGQSSHESSKNISSSQGQTLQRAASEGRLGHTQSAPVDVRHEKRITKEHNHGDPARARSRRTVTNQIVARHASIGASNRQQRGWHNNAPASDAALGIPRTPSRSSRAQPEARAPQQRPAKESEKLETAKRPDNGRILEAETVAGTAAARMSALSALQSRVPAVQGSREGEASVAQRLPLGADRIAPLRAKSPNTQMNAALALRRLVTPPTSLETTSSLPPENTIPNGPSRGAMQRVASSERLLSSLGGIGLKSQEDFQVQELAGTLQRLCEIEDERRRLFEEYDDILLRAANAGQSLPLRREAPHAADVSAGGAQSGPKSPKSSVKSPLTSSPTGATPSTPAGSSRRALSAATERTDAQLSELLRKSDRLRSLLADVTATP